MCNPLRTATLEVLNDSTVNGYSVDDMHMALDNYPSLDVSKVEVLNALNDLYEEILVDTLLDEEDTEASHHVRYVLHDPSLATL